MMRGEGDEEDADYVFFSRCALVVFLSGLVVLIISLFWSTG
jgi:hypothetical protein